MNELRVNKKNECVSGIKLMKCEKNFDQIVCDTNQHLFRNCLVRLTL